MSLNETVFFFFIIIFLVSSLQPSTSVEITGSSCGIQPIRFPFCLNNQPISCGYPRFNLSCKNEAQAILTLPFSGDFSVVNIDYIFQYIRINDPDSCAAKHLIHGLNLSGTPFDLLHPRSYTFFNCSSDTTLTELKLPDAIYVSCLSGTALSVVAKPTERLNSSASLLTTSCSEMATVLVPLSWTGSSDARDDIVLTWDEPDCKLCERRGGICLLKSDTGMDIGCFGGLSNGLTVRTKFRIIFGVGFSMLFFISLLIYLHCKSDDSRNERQNFNPEDSSVIRGLDVQTIDSYPITLLGESRRLARPSDTTCSICLGEYQAKETLRTIPGCNHYFHANCIDEWLRLNVVCPLCRSFPENSDFSTISSS